MVGVVIKKNLALLLTSYRTVYGRNMYAESAISAIIYSILHISGGKILTCFIKS